MALTQDLMGLGMHPFLATKVSRNPRSVTAAGDSLGNATAIGNTTQIAYIISTTGGSGTGVKLPNIGGDAGCLLGDDILVVNGLQAGITVYASNSATFLGKGVSASGNTGVAIATVNTCIFYSVTATTWAYVLGGSA